MMLVILLASGFALAMASLPPVLPQDGCLYNVPGAGLFAIHESVDFTNTFTLPDFLSISSYKVTTGPLPHLFVPANVRFEADGALSLLVEGPASDPVLSAELITTAHDILYGSVRTMAKTSTANGTTNGIFFYHDDSQETDIEVCTSDPTVVHFTNQPVNGGESSTVASEASSDLSAQYHEYRLDWLPDSTSFYLDGELVVTLHSNVPNVAGSHLWNNWSNGGSWTGGPPASTSEMKIKYIDSYFNRTSVTGCST